MFFNKLLRDNPRSILEHFINIATVSNYLVAFFFTLKRLCFELGHQIIVAD